MSVFFGTLRACPAAVAFAAAVALCGGLASEGYAAPLNQNMKWGDALMAQNDLPPSAQGLVVVPKTGRAAPAAKAGGKSTATGVAPQPSAIDTANTVNKMLAPRAVDPNVPLPQQDLAQVPSENGPSGRTRFYGRNESENGVLGGVLGLKIPIPASGGLSGGSSTSGVNSAP